MAVTRGLGKQAATTEDDVKAIRRYLQQFDDLDLIRARPVRVVFPASTQVVAVAHGLRRPYVGAVCVGVSFAAGAGVLPPEDAARTGVDIGVYAIFHLDATVTGEVRANFRVF